MLTAILSSFNESDNEVFWSNLKLLHAFPTSLVEVLVVDGGSEDGTLKRLAEFGEFMQMPHSQRGDRYNLGVGAARGQLILLVHPRSRLPREGIEFLTKMETPGPVWGAFRHSFDWSHPLLRFTSWYSNFVRGSRRSIYYLDHCLFFSSHLRDRARFPPLSLFEDTHFCLRLRRQARPQLLPFRVETAAIRFRKNGLLKQSLLNQLLKILFHLGVSEKWMVRIYEKGLSLNLRVK